MEHEKFDAVTESVLDSLRHMGLDPCRPGAAALYFCAAAAADMALAGMAWHACDVAQAYAEWCGCNTLAVWQRMRRALRGANVALTVKQALSMIVNEAVKKGEEHENGVFAG